MIYKKIKWICICKVKRFLAFFGETNVRGTTGFGGLSAWIRVSMVRSPVHEMPMILTTEL